MANRDVNNYVMAENKKMNNGLKFLITKMQEIQGKVYHWDDFYETGLGEFGETLILGEYVFKCKSSTDTLFEKDTILADKFEGFRGFTLCTYECEKKFYPSEHDFEPNITVLQADDRIYIVGYSKGFEC